MPQVWNVRSFVTVGDNLLRDDGKCYAVRKDRSRDRHEPHDRRASVWNTRGSYNARIAGPI